MLYTADSIEIVSPLALREAPLQVADSKSWTANLTNRFAQPRLDMALCLGSHSFVVTMPNKSFVFPARVAVKGQANRIVAVGPRAAEIEGREPEGVTVVRPIQGGVITDERLATRLLKGAMSASKHGVLSAPRVAVAVPSDLSAVESQALLATVKAAGASSVYLIEQTLAAAIGAGRDLKKAEGHMVVHIGAGVTHISVASLASTVLSRSLRIAGDAMNEALSDYVRQQHHLLIDDRVAESIKRELGAALPTEAKSEMTIAGRDIALGKPAERRINSEEVYQVLKPLLARIAQEVRWIVSSADLPLLQDVLGNGVILSGGSAQLRRLDEFLAQETRLRVQTAASPEEVVSKGLQIILRESTLRKAVFHQARPSSSTYDSSEKRGTGLLGLLFLAGAVAFAAHSAPLLGQGAMSSIDSYLGSAFTPSASLSQGWGWQPPAPVDVRASMHQQESELEKENARLRKLLKAPLAKPSYQPIAADVVARDPRGWMSTLTLNVGKDRGIAVGMTVTDGTHLVGRVSRVENARAQVRLFTDSKAVVAGKLAQRKASGVLVGKGQDDLEMRYLDPDSGVKTGDWVVTSGHDGLFPSGLKIGWVTNVTQPSGQNTLSAVIQPAINIHHLDNVLVLKNDPTKKPDAKKKGPKG